MIPIDELQQLVGDAKTDLHVLVALEEAAVAFVQTQTRRYFGGREEFQEIVQGRGSRYLYLSHAAEDAVLGDAYFDASITVTERVWGSGGGRWGWASGCGCTPSSSGSDGVDPDTGLVTDWELRRFEGETALVRTSGVWLRGAEYTVTYTRGYEEGNEPADIKRLVANLVKVGLDAMTTDAGLRSETIGGYSYSYGNTDLSQLDDTDQMTLDAWRRLVVA